MAQLSVRNIEEALVRRLKLRAAEHGRSAEAEHREILREALLQSSETKRSFKELLGSMPEVGTDQDFRRSRQRGRKVAF